MEKQNETILFGFDYSVRFLIFIYVMQERTGTCHGAAHPDCF